MNYIYRLEREEIKEINIKNNYETIVWEIADLKEKEPNINSLWFNRKQAREEKIDSFMRTKKWILENYAELLL